MKAHTFILVFGFCLLASLAHSHETHPLKMTVEATIERPPDKFALTITLVNTTERILTINKWDLPWVYWYAMQIMAAKVTDTLTPLVDEFPVHDPGFNRYSIEPGEQLQGTILLHRRFPTLWRDVKEYDIIIFWTYDVNSYLAESLGRQGGWVFIPKLNLDGEKLNGRTGQNPGP